MLQLVLLHARHARHRSQSPNFRAAAAQLIHVHTLPLFLDMPATRQLLLYTTQ